MHASSHSLGAAAKTGGPDIVYSDDLDTWTQVYDEFWSSGRVKYELKGLLQADDRRSSRGGNVKNCLESLFASSTTHARSHSLGAAAKTGGPDTVYSDDLSSSV